MNVLMCLELMEFPTSAFKTRFQYCSTVSLPTPSVASARLVAHTGDKRALRVKVTVNGLGDIRRRTAF